MAEVIQLVVAPVFLLVAIGSLLGVVTGRLGRVVDRARELESRLLQGVEKREHGAYTVELRTLDRRIRYNSWSINFLSMAALIVALLVAALFVSYLWAKAIPVAIALLFITAIVGVMLGIIFFIAEVYLATRTVRVRSDLIATK